MTANQIEHDAPVNVAGRFARRHLKVGQINFSHFGGGTARFSLGKIGPFSTASFGHVLQNSSGPLLVRGAN